MNLSEKYEGYKVATIVIHGLHYGWMLGTLGALVVVWLGFIIVEAYYETVRAPKVDMYDCQKHGLVPKHLCITFDEKEDDNPLTEQQYQCPFCYEDAFKIADETLKKQERTRV